MNQSNKYIDEAIKRFRKEFNLNYPPDRNLLLRVETFLAQEIKQAEERTLDLVIEKLGDKLRKIKIQWPTNSKHRTTRVLSLSEARKIVYKLKEKDNNG